MSPSLNRSGGQWPSDVQRNVPIRLQSESNHITASRATLLQMTANSRYGSLLSPKSL